MRYMFRGKYSGHGLRFLVNKRFNLGIMLINRFVDDRINKEHGSSGLIVGRLSFDKR